MKGQVKGLPLLVSAGPFTFNYAMIDTSRIADNIRRLRDELESELATLGRTPQEITIVAVSKAFDSDAIAAAAQCGLADFGENRIQEAKDKIPAVNSPRELTWHLVGNLQTNKVKEAVALFDLIQSVESKNLAEQINRRAASIGKKQDVLIEVNTSGETQKKGCRIEAVDDLIGEIIQLGFVRIRGLMTIGPLSDEITVIAGSFRRLRTIFDRLTSQDLHGGEMRDCSMGMTDDWRIALAEDANMLRVGRAIFGDRGGIGRATVRPYG